MSSDTGAGTPFLDTFKRGSVDRDIRLMEKDVKALTTDRNVPDVVRLAARKRLAPTK